MFKRIISGIALAALIATAVSLASCKKKEAALSGEVRIAGSSTVYPVSVAVAEEFNKLYPEVLVPVQSTGTGGGFSNFFLPGKTDINDASRKIKDSETETAKAAGFDVLEIQVGIDAITIVVNPEANWVDDITVEQLAQIWRPENPAVNWSDVDPSWPDEKIELYGPTSASGTFEFFTEEIVGEAFASRSDYQGTEQDNTIVQAVSGSRYAMGYFGMAYYLENKDRVKALAVEGVLPGIEAAKSGEYTPLSRPLFIYVNSRSLERPEVKEYVRFYIDQTDTEMIKEIGYVPMTTEEKNKNMQNFEAMIK